MAILHKVSYLYENDIDKFNNILKENGFFICSDGPQYVLLKGERQFGQRFETAQAAYLWAIQEIFGQDSYG